MKQPFFLLLIMLTIYSYGQQSIGIVIDGGLSKISSNDYNPLFSTQKTYFVPSGQAGLFYSLPIRTHEIFIAEILFSQIEGKTKGTDTTGTYGAGNGTTTPILQTQTITKHISYLNIPLYYGVKLGKFSIHIGFQTSLTLARSGKVITQSNFDPTTFSLGNYTTTYTTHKLFVKDGAFSQVGKLIYNITPKIAVEGNYCYNLNNLYRNSHAFNGYQPIWQFQQITIGIRYKFFTSK
jgi:hypothetical protein